MDNGGHRRPTDAVVPHSRRRRTRQSANIMEDYFMRGRREWDNDVSTEVVGYCDVCFARNIS